MGGVTTGYDASRKVYSIHLDCLIHEAVSQPANASVSLTPSPWQSLPDTPLPQSTALAINGALLAIGGNLLRSKDIYHYRPRSRSWMKAGELPIGRSMCACAVLLSGEMFVAGGLGGNKRVDIASLE